LSRVSIASERKSAANAIAKGMMRLETLTAVVQIALALGIGAVSPGPSFIMVSQTALSATRRAALGAALGMGIGGMVFATLALVGLTRTLAAAPALYLTLKIAGGSYLLFLAVRIIRSADRPLVPQGSHQPTEPRSPRASLLRGLITQLANPKTAIVYASVFAALLPRDVSMVGLALTPLVVFVVETGWYAIVAMTLSADRPRARYLAAKRWIDRTAGSILGLLGARLIVTAGQ
jgi:threonine/homoserine/homoserine lactone efflux protein